MIANEQCAVGTDVELPVMQSGDDGQCALVAGVGEGFDALADSVEAR